VLGRFPGRILNFLFRRRRTLSYFSVLSMRAIMMRRELSPAFSRRDRCQLRPLDSRALPLPFSLPSSGMRRSLSSVFLAI